MDVNYIKGMINNLDLQPNATINHWIARILLFHFKLIHISADKHKEPDGLSCRPHLDTDQPEEDDFEDWLDNVYSFTIVLLNEQPHPDLYSYWERGWCYSHTYLPIGVWVYLNGHNLCNTPLLEADTSKIPRSTRVRACGNRIQQIYLFLETQDKLNGMSDKDYKSFLNSTTCFFILNGSLWYCEPHGKRQLVVPKSQCFRLIKEAQNNLRHKDVFTI
jgi:hypothetical protein